MEVLIRFRKMKRTNKKLMMKLKINKFLNLAKQLHLIIAQKAKKIFKNHYLVLLLLSTSQLKTNNKIYLIQL